MRDYFLPPPISWHVYWYSHGHSIVESFQGCSHANFGGPMLTVSVVLFTVVLMMVKDPGTINVNV